MRKIALQVLKNLNLNAKKCSKFNFYGIMLLRRFKNVTLS